MSYFLRSPSCKVASLFCEDVGMEPHAKTPPPPVLSPEVTQALELLQFWLEHIFQNLWWNQYQRHNHKHNKNPSIA